MEPSLWTPVTSSSSGMGNIQCIVAAPGPIGATHMDVCYPDRSFLCPNTPMLNRDFKRLDTTTKSGCKRTIGMGPRPDGKRLSDNCLRNWTTLSTMS